MKECYNRRNAKCSVSSFTQKEDTKKIEKHKVQNSNEKNDIDSSCTNNESQDRKGDTSHNDQDSDVFEIDNNENIDAVEIEEEELVEYIKRSIIEALENGKRED